MSGMATFDALLSCLNCASVHWRRVKVQSVETHAITGLQVNLRCEDCGALSLIRFERTYKDEVVKA